ncbi:hypothetical protein CYY_005559 [Polysphondylium violaceum]|uniref:Uncharacterized protein n=1 Tax=Polysphondylium violaceum TaxID=133409 RepID=A0A8J4PSQ1_9MYCE|nr:hypothetical protein CYY_005559 [Polysphondylium violaceum]
MHLSFPTLSGSVGYSFDLYPFRRIEVSNSIFYFRDIGFPEKCSRLNEPGSISKMNNNERDKVLISSITEERQFQESSSDDNSNSQGQRGTTTTTTVNPSSTLMNQAQAIYLLYLF